LPREGPLHGRRRNVCALAAIFGVLLPATASAHPHVFIDNRVTFLFSENKIVGFRENWLFDDVFSDQMLQDFDADGDGKYSKAESDKIAAETLPNLAQFHYFTFVWVDGKPLAKIPPKDFHASAKNKLVTFDFMVTLPKPVDPSTQDIAVEINDREYFVEVLLAKDAPIAFKELTGKDLTGLVCEPSVTKDEKNAYYGGFVYPQQIKLKCK
jgi:ABC-type uncharacterized transport system substrate-binding protein